MKRLATYFALAVAAMAAFSCAKEENIIETPGVELFPMSFTATSAETKTVLEEDGMSISWLATDKISVFDGVGNQEFTTVGSGKTVKFDGTAAAADKYYAVYPYDENAALSGTTVATTLAANQTPTVGSFADGLNINAAVSTDKTTFVFDNVLSVVKFNVDNSQLGGKTIKKIELTTAAAAAGDVNITFGENIAASAGATTTKTVYMEKSDGLADGAYYFTLFPQDAGKIRFQVTSTDGYLARVEATVKTAFVAGSIKPLGTIKNLNWTKVFFYESFDICDGKGGNDGEWSGNIATGNTSYDNTGWTESGSVNKANKCIKFASNKNEGSSETPALANIPTSTDVKLAFKAGSWSGKNATMSVSVTGGGTLGTTSFNPADAAWSEYRDIALTGAGAASKIKFSAASNNQSFLDEVLVYVGDYDLALETLSGDAGGDSGEIPADDPDSEKTSTLTFTAACNGSGTADDGAEWTVTSDGSESSYVKANGIHYGTGSAQVQYIKLSTSDITGKITKIVVNASTASKVEATASVTVGGSEFGGDAQSLTTTAKDYTFEGSVSGEIIVTIAKPSQATKALYVKSIAVTYTSK